MDFVKKKPDEMRTDTTRMFWIGAKCWTWLCLVDARPRYSLEVVLEAHEVTMLLFGDFDWLVFVRGGIVPMSNYMIRMIKILVAQDLKQCISVRFMVPNGGLYSLQVVKVWMVLRHIRPHGGEGILCVDGSWLCLWMV